MYHTVSEDKAKRIIASIPSAGVVAVFKALGDPTRVRIIHLLAQAELYVHDLAQLLGTTQPTMSHHLKLLRMLQLVRTRRAGRAVYYSLDDEHVLELFTCSRDHLSDRLNLPWVTRCKLTDFRT